MTLDEFLQELAARRGLHRKVGLLARYWRQVQSLPTDKQQQIALALGSKAAWSRLEKLFARDGTLSDGELAVKRALDRVGGADPDELRDLAAKVRSGSYADVSWELVEMLGQALDEEAIDSDAEPADIAAAIDELAAGGEAVSDDAVSDDAVSDDTLSDDTAPGKVVSDETAPEAATPDATAPNAAAAPAPAADLTDDLPHAAEATVAAFATASSPPTRKVDSEPVPPPPLEAIADPTTARVPALSAAEKLGVLRALRADPGYGTRLGRSGRAELLARLGPGWAARRGLSELIRGQGVSNLDEVLQLTGNLHSEVQKAWCLGDLVEHWALSETELERVLRAAPGPAATNRLRARHARQGSSRRA